MPKATGVDRPAHYGGGAKGDANPGEGGIMPEGAPSLPGNLTDAGAAGADLLTSQAVNASIEAVNLAVAEEKARHSMVDAAISAMGS